MVRGDRGWMEDEGETNTIDSKKGYIWTPDFTMWQNKGGL